MSLAHRRAVIAGLVTGGFLLSGLSVSTQDPAFASVGTASPSPSATASTSSGPSASSSLTPISTQPIRPSRHPGVLSLSVSPPRSADSDRRVPGALVAAIWLPARH